MKEIRIPHSDPGFAKSDCTELNQRLLAREFDGDMQAIHKHEVESIEDDFDRGERVMKIRKRKFFFT